MTVVATPLLLGASGESVSAQGDMFLALFTLAFSGSYTTGGEPWNPLAAIGGPAPSKLIVVDITGGAGLDPEYDAVNFKIKFFSASSTELAAGAYPAALTGDVNTIAQVYAK